MAHNFTHSRVVIRRLAQETARTPPSEEDSPFEYVDRSLTILGRISDSHSERIREEFLSQHKFIATQIKEVETKIDGRLNELNRKIEQVDVKMDRRFHEVDRKIEQVDEKMRQRFGHMQNALRNSLRTRGWEQIYPVGSFDADGGVRIPVHFPHTVKRFWELKDSSRMHRLIDLLRFYGIQGYEEWGVDTDSLEGISDSDDSSEKSSKSSRLPIPLETAVRSNPEIAHRALAAHLGLVYDGIQRFMERAQELSQAPVMRTKRGQSEQASEDRKRRSFKMSPEGTEVTSPTDRSTQGRTGYC